MTNRWLAVPVIAITAWAQETSPSAAEAEKALRARVEEFYQLQMDKKYRLAEKYVAEDTKDWYFSTGRGELLGFSIMKVEMLEGNTKANVTIKARSTMMVMGAGRLPYEMPSVTQWKIENGEWVWYIASQNVRQTPFGEMKATGDPKSAQSALAAAFAKAPSLDALKSQVVADKTTVTLSPENAEEIVMITNGLPGAADLEPGPNLIPGVAVDLDRKHLGAGEKATLRLRRIGSGSTSGAVSIAVSPLGTTLEIRVSVE